MQRVEEQEEHKNSFMFLFIFNYISRENIFPLSFSVLGSVIFIATHDIKRAPPQNAVEKKRKRREKKDFCYGKKINDFRVKKRVSHDEAIHALTPSSFLIIFHRAE